MAGGCARPSSCHLQESNGASWSAQGKPAPCQGTWETVASRPGAWEGRAGGQEGRTSSSNGQGAGEAPPASACPLPRCQETAPTPEEPGAQKSKGFGTQKGQFRPPRPSSPSTPSQFHEHTPKVSPHSHTHTQTHSHIHSHTHTGLQEPQTHTLDPWNVSRLVPRGRGRGRPGCRGGGPSESLLIGCLAGVYPIAVHVHWF